MSEKRVPAHIGIIMDGNGRWAKNRGMPRNYGHYKGALTFRKCIKWCRELGISCASFYAFSTENWSRPADEIKGIMDLIRRYLKDIRKEAENGTRMIILGDVERLDEDIRRELLDIEELSRANKGFTAGIALNYGGRAEIVSAIKGISADISAGKLTAGEITEELVEKYLYTSEMPPLDMVIRPSGEMRLSNFMIWQAAYAEFVFMDILWPDFKKRDLERAISEFSKRNRRFGGV